MLASSIERREQPVGRFAVGIDGAARFEANAERRAQEPVVGECAVEDDLSIADGLKRCNIGFTCREVAERR